jgi:hypothetical protein
MKNKKNLIIIGLLLVCGFIVFKYSDNVNEQINTNTTDTTTTTETTLLDTSDWETCRNEEYGYEFKYPKDWYIYERIVSAEAEVESSFITEKHSCQGKLIILSQNQTVRGGWSSPTINTSVFDDNWDDSLEEYLQKFDTEIFPVFITKKEIFNGIKIIKYNRQRSLHAILLHKKTIIDLTVTTKDDSQDEFLNKVLSTFKFID